MKNPIMLPSFFIIPNNTIANKVSTYTFFIVFKLQHLTQDKIYIIIPSEITINSNFSCLSIYGLQSI